MPDSSDLVDLLATIRLPDLFNPYTDLDPLHDLPDAPVRRQANLRTYLDQMLARRPTELWLAESGSHTGTRRSGLPLIPTTEVTALNERFDTDSFSQPTRTDDRPGMTASYVWEAALRRPRLPLLWNAVMAQPHKSGQPYRNRPTRQIELQSYLPVLQQLLKVYAPRDIVAIGRVAERMLQTLNVPHRYVRHPAQGGAAAFCRGVHQ